MRTKCFQEKPLKSFIQDLAELAAKTDVSCLVLQFKDRHEFLFSDLKNVLDTLCKWADESDFIHIVGSIGARVDFGGHLHVWEESYVPGITLDVISEELRANGFGGRIRIKQEEGRS